MAKDPAFPFYSSDFLTGTMIMTDEEVGKYIRLLCYQHQHGHFDESAMQSLCKGNATALIKSKFEIDENGLYYNERLDKEMIKRREHAEKQRQNALKRWECDGIATAMPLENEIEIRKENKKSSQKKERTNKAQKVEVLDLIPKDWPADGFMEIWNEFLEVRRLKKKPLTENAVKRRISELVGLSGGSYHLAQKIAQKACDAGWEAFYALKPESDFQNGQKTGIVAGKTIRNDRA